MSFRIANKLKRLYDADKSQNKAIFTKEIKEAIEKKELNLDPIWRDVYEAVDSTTFATLMQHRLNVAVKEGYDQVSTPLKGLFREVQSKAKKEAIIDISLNADIDEVEEGEDYKEASMRESHIEIKNAKFGRILTITEETLMFDKLGAVLDAANRLGYKAALKEERKRAEVIVDAGGDGYGGQPVYSSSHGNLGSTALTPDSLASAVTAMRRQKDANGDPLGIIPIVLLVPPELERTAIQLLSSDLEPESPGSSKYNWVKDLKLKPLVSPFLEDTDDWYLIGDGGLREQVVYPLQVIKQTLSQNDRDAFYKDLKALFKVRFYKGWGVEAYQYLYKAQV